MMFWLALPLNAQDKRGPNVDIIEPVDAIELAPTDLPQSEPLLWPNGEISLLPLDLSRPPTAKELSAAGGMGGPLTPIDIADVDQLVTKGGNTAQVKRLLEINWDFGRALAVLKTHNYPKTIELYQEHLKKYPTSPWAGEIFLHLGKFAAAEGRYTEAEERYAAILKATSDKPDQPTYDMAQKTKMAWASLDMMLGRWNSAQAKLENILDTELHWRRISWARYFWQEADVNKRSPELQACGAHALATVLVSLGKKEAASKIEKLPAPREEGFNLAELVQLARKNGVPMQGFEGKIADLKDLPMPLLVHYDFGASETGTATPHCEKCVMLDGQYFDRPSLSGKQRTLEGPFSLDAKAKTKSIQHFLIVRGVDAKTQQVKIYNPLEKREYRLTYAQFDKEWSGAGLMLEKPRLAQKAGKQDLKKSSVAKGKTQAGPVRVLSLAEMALVHGGCCCLDKPQDNLGISPSVESVGGSCPRSNPDGLGSPVVSMNHSNLNYRYGRKAPAFMRGDIRPSVA